MNVEGILESGEQDGIATVMYGSPYWKHSELSFEKKELIPALQQLLIAYTKLVSQAH